MVLYGEGNLDEYIYHEANDEFSYLYLAFNDMEDRLKQLITIDCNTADWQMVTVISHGAVELEKLRTFYK